ncbi:MAG: hypothetical protein FD174_653 [Geobacteraceae bacterium]|nr:MAG: hypothetical protein FD174_653 [Geobacteraceae bacterium]
MSSILKALKKLEDEKAARSGKTADIAGAILKTGRRKEQKQKWLILTGMLFVAVAAVLATYALMGGFSHMRQETAPVTATPSNRPETTAPSFLDHAPPPAGPSVIENRPSLMAPRTITKVLPAMQTAAPTASPQQPAPTAETRTETAQPATAAPLPVLSVSGIAWQKDSASRLAVVNGMSVTQGATVGGARVEEIFPDRVRFSLENRTVEVLLGKTSGD